MYGDAGSGELLKFLGGGCCISPLFPAVFWALGALGVRGQGLVCGGAGGGKLLKFLGGVFLLCVLKGGQGIVYGVGGSWAPRGGRAHSRRTPKHAHAAPRARRARCDARAARQGAPAAPSRNPGVVLRPSPFHPSNTHTPPPHAQTRTHQVRLLAAYLATHPERMDAAKRWGLERVLCGGAVPAGRALALSCGPQACPPSHLPTHHPTPPPVAHPNPYPAPPPLPHSAQWQKVGRIDPDHMAAACALACLGVPVDRPPPPPGAAGAAAKAGLALGLGRGGGGGGRKAGTRSRREGRPEGAYALSRRGWWGVERAHGGGAFSLPSEVHPAAAARAGRKRPNPPARARATPLHTHAFTPPLYTPPTPAGLTRCCWTCWRTRPRAGSAPRSSPSCGGGGGGCVCACVWGGAGVDGGWRCGDGASSAPRSSPSCGGSGGGCACLCVCGCVSVWVGWGAGGDALKDKGAGGRGPPECTRHSSGLAHPSRPPDYEANTPTHRHARRSPAEAEDAFSPESIRAASARTSRPAVNWARKARAAAAFRAACARRPGARPRRWRARLDMRRAPRAGPWRRRR